MTTPIIKNWTLCGVFLCSLFLFSFCRESENTNELSNNHITKSFISKNLTKGDTRFIVNHSDTVLVRTSKELINQIRSNRLIKLVENNYTFDATLVIEGINNLKIEGAGFPKLMIKENNETVIRLLNSQNIHLNSLEIGHGEGPIHIGDHGVVQIVDSHDVTISSSTILGSGTIGLFTKNSHNLAFNNIHISSCTFLIFELLKSENIEFTDSKFQDNNLSVSVLGAFTDSTKQIHFLNCDFLNNTPKMEGNPAFNFMDNWINLDDPIVFTNCSFKNNKGYVWYGEKMELNNCQMDSTDFLRFE